jgi:UDP-glucose 4-epimerase
MVRRLLTAGAAEIRVFSRDEAKQDDMRRRLGDDRVRFYVGDVRDLAALTRATRAIEYVFHAAALKQVPSCEFFPLEAVQTNILGSANVVDACERNGVSAVVLPEHRQGGAAGQLDGDDQGVDGEGCPGARA